MVLAFYDLPYGPLAVYQVSFNSLVYFQRCAPDELFIANIKKESYSVNTVDKVMILAFCTFSDSPLSINQLSFNSLLCFQRLAPDKLFIAKNKKESSSLKTVDKVTILALCTFFGSSLSMY